MPIVLGKDCAISVDGNLVGVRSISVSATARTVDVEEFGSRLVTVYQTGRDTVLSCELNNTDSIGGLAGAIASGEEVTVSGGAGGWAYPGVVTGLSESTSVDGVATFTAEVRLTRPGLRM